MNLGPGAGATSKFAVVTNIPTPYRDGFFEAVARAVGRDRFFVLFLGAADAGRMWSNGDRDYEHRILSRRTLTVQGKTFHVGANPRRTLSEWAPDVVVIGGWDEPGQWLARRWCLRNRVPAVAWIESHERSGQGRGRAASALRRRFLRGFSGAIVPGTESREFLSGLGFSGRFLELPNPIAAPPPPAVERQLPADSGRNSDIVLLFVGSLDDRKNPVRVVDIAAAAKALNREVRIVCAGEGPLKGAVKAAAEAAGIPAELPGFRERDELEALWREAACLILPSLRDPAPLVLSEAAARGVPFVASDACGGASTLIARGAAGAVLPLSADDSTWAEAALEISSRPAPPVLDVLPDQAAKTFTAYLTSLGSGTL